LTDLPKTDIDLIRIGTRATYILVSVGIRQKRNTAKGPLIVLKIARSEGTKRIYGLDRSGFEAELTIKANWSSVSSEDTAIDLLLSLNKHLLSPRVIFIWILENMSSNMREDSEQDRMIALPQINFPATIYFRADPEASIPDLSHPDNVKPIALIVAQVLQRLFHHEIRCQPEFTQAMFDQIVQKV